jgi:23S rRNA pseudoU1915 N3-methylase RlmH
MIIFIINITTNPMDVDADSNNKTFAIYNKLQDFVEKNGVVLTKEFTLYSDLEEMEVEYEFQKRKIKEREIKKQEEEDIIDSYVYMLGFLLMMYI